MPSYSFLLLASITPGLLLFYQLPLAWKSWWGTSGPTLEAVKRSAQAIRIRSDEAGLLRGKTSGCPCREPGSQAGTFSRTGLGSSVGHPDSRDSGLLSVVA